MSKRKEYAVFVDNWYATTAREFNYVLRISTDLDRDRSNQIRVRDHRTRRPTSLVGRLIVVRRTKDYVPTTSNGRQAIWEVVTNEQT